jgi:hypothetical protein
MPYCSPGGVWSLITSGSTGWLNSSHSSSSRSAPAAPHSQRPVARRRDIRQGRRPVDSCVPRDQAVSRTRATGSRQDQYVMITASRPSLLWVADLTYVPTGWDVLPRLRCRRLLPGWSARGLARRCPRSFTSTRWRSRCGSGSEQDTRSGPGPSLRAASKTGLHRSPATLAGEPTVGARSGLRRVSSNRGFAGLLFSVARAPDQVVPW